MRYFYHLNKRYPNTNLVYSSNELIEVNEDGYNRIVEDELRIIKEKCVAGWHFPIMSEDVPDGKILIRKVLYENR